MIVSCGNKMRSLGDGKGKDAGREIELSPYLCAFILVHNADVEIIDRRYRSLAQGFRSVRAKFFVIG